MTISVIARNFLSQATESDQAEASCAAARRKLEIGDYDGGVQVLSPWWTLGAWPRHSGLSIQASAELLLMAGTLSGLIASTKQLPGGQRPAEGLLNGSIALFEQMREKK